MGIRELPWNLGRKSKSPGGIRIEDNLSPKLDRLGQRSEPDPENPRTTNLTRFGDRCFRRCCDLKESLKRVRNQITIIQTIYTYI
jgi:hypothetical protein